MTTNTNDIPEWVIPLPDETIVRLDDDSFRITVTTTGHSFDMTTKELYAYQNGDDLDTGPSTLELVDKFISELPKTELIRTTEVLDILLDIRNSAENTDRGLKLAVSMYCTTANDLLVYKETFGECTVPNELLQDIINEAM